MSRDPRKEGPFVKPPKRLPGKPPAGKVWQFELAGANAPGEYRHAVKDAVAKCGGVVTLMKGRDVSSELRATVQVRGSLAAFAKAYRALVLETRESTLGFAVSPPPGFKDEDEYGLSTRETPFKAVRP